MNKLEIYTWRSGNRTIYFFLQILFTKQVDQILKYGMLF